MHLIQIHDIGLYAPIFDLGKQLERDYNLDNPIADDYQYNNF